MRLASVADDDVPVEEGDEDLDFAALAEKELMRRLRTKPQSLPAAFLTKMFLEGKKAAEAPVEVMEQADLLAALPALPRAHALSLLDAEIARKREVLQRYEDERARITGRA